MKELIANLCKPSGPSGHEGQIANMIKELVAPLVQETYSDALGNLYAIKRPEGGDSGRTVLLAAHMDEPALSVIDIAEHGFLRVAPLGKLQAAALVGQRVVFGRTGRCGVVGVEHGVELKDITFHHLFVDIGAEDQAQAAEFVRVGDAATFAYGVDEIGADLLVGHALDNRVSCAVLLEVLKNANSKDTIVAVFTAQKEVGSRGAHVAGYRIKPDLAIAVDLSLTGDTPEGDRIALELGKGPAIKMLDASMVVAPGLRDQLIDAAERAGVAYQFEVSPRAESDAGAIFLARDGIPTCGVVIPARYLGTPSQMVSLQDVSGASEVLVAMLETGTA